MHHIQDCDFPITNELDIMQSYTKTWTYFSTLRPRQNGHHFVDDSLKCIFFNENVWIPIEISLKFVPKGQINNIPALVQIMAWRRPGDKPLSEPVMVRLSTHICVTRPQWVKQFSNILSSYFGLAICQNSSSIQCPVCMTSSHSLSLHQPHLEIV